MRAYYNEIDPFAAQWLRNLIAGGHIAPGDVDERSIEDVRPDDLAGYNQCHFFAGIGGWSLALRYAGVPDDYPVWTGSCPCQPFSAAGKGAGFDDERHLWPAFQWLIQQRRPPVVFGEQVASKAVDPWIDLVHADMEAMGYAFGCVPFPSAGVGAPHIRDRLFWVGHTDEPGSQGHARHGGSEGWQGTSGSVAQTGVSGGLVDSDTQRRDRQHPSVREGQGSHAEAPRSGSDVQSGRGRGPEQPGISSDPNRLAGTGLRPGPTNGFWADADWLACRDGKWRPVEPGTFPLAHGVPNRVGRLRGYGNAINPIQAAEFVGVFMEVTHG